MIIPTYKKGQVDYAISQGDHSLSEFEEYLEELITSELIEGPALGVAKQALSEGTEGLTQKQLNALAAGLSQYDMEHCEGCHAVMAVNPKSEGPHYCENCEDRIRQKIDAA